MSSVYQVLLCQKRTIASIKLCTIPPQALLKSQRCRHFPSLDDLADLAHRLGDGELARVHPLPGELVHLEHQLRLRTDHVRRHQHLGSLCD